MRNALRWAWVYFLYLTGCLWWAGYALRKSGAIIVLTFHRVLVAGARTNSQTELIVRRQTFDDICAHLKSRFEVVPLESSGPGNVSKRLRVVCTFDGGWEDNALIAFPVIQRYGLPVTIFICPGLLDQCNPFWPERAVANLKAWNEAAIDECIESLKGLPPEQRRRAIEILEHGKSPAFISTDRTMSWDDVREMAGMEVAFGSSTMVHEILTNLTWAQAQYEMTASKLALESELGKPCATLAYPNGNNSSSIRRLAKLTGYHRAMGNSRQAWTVASDAFAVPRFSIYEGNVVGPFGKFSPAMFLYATAWQGWIRMCRTGIRARLGITPGDLAAPKRDS
jgi:peptidoglycan/xylan/chitin deacetylase (PgdA/CDA1 family)